MRYPRSLRERLSLAAALVTAVSLGALAFVFNLVLSQQLRSGADDLLRSRAAATVASVQVGADGSISIRKGPDDRTIERTTWIYRRRTAIDRAPGDRQQQAQADALAQVGERMAESSEPEAVRYFALPLRSNGRQVGTIVSSVGLEPYDRAARLALVASAALALLALAGAYVLTRTLIGRVLAPVAEMTDQAARWSSEGVDRRFGPGKRPIELATLALTLDGVLDRLSAVLRHEQQLSAELSHELRTPLTAIVAEIELLDSRSRSPDELSAGHAAVLAAADRMRQVLESLLTAARAASGGAPGRSVVADAVHRAIESLHADAPNIVVHCGDISLTAGVEAALLERAIAPVLENALRFRRSAVSVSIDRGPAGPWVSVRDDGPGVDPELRESLFEPGVSGSVGGHGGAGLGLALARRLARAGGGELEHDPVAGPGAVFVLTLPGD